MRCTDRYDGYEKRKTPRWELDDVVTWLFEDFTNSEQLREEKAPAIKAFLGGRDRFILVLGFVLGMFTTLAAHLVWVFVR
jgi:hypothetical protein